MYWSYFGFREEPFGVCPDERFLFPSSQHAEASASLYYAISGRRGFAALIGAPGLGKTSILVNLVARLSRIARVAFFVHPQFQSESVLDSVLLAIGLTPEPDLVSRHRQLHEFLSDLNRQGKTCVVIFDEAQHLDVGALEAIRMLSNFETPRHKLIQFVLAGQPGLARLLHSEQCRQILQRVNIFARLEPLSSDEVAPYIEYRLAVASAPRNPFAPDAVQAIAAASRGVPRNINTICFNALTLAFALDRKAVDVADIAEVVRDRAAVFARAFNSEAPGSRPASISTSEMRPWALAHDLKLETARSALTPRDGRSALRSSHLDERDQYLSRLRLKKA